MNTINLNDVVDLIKAALVEDLGLGGDITTQATIGHSTIKKAYIKVKEDGIIAGLNICENVFKVVDPNLKITLLVKDGDFVKSKDKVIEIEGKAESIVIAERTALNFMGRMSGVATLTSKAVKKTIGTKAKILDTRKTMPGMRILDKYSVKIGGGENHRIGLFDMFMIKENHIEAAGSLKNAVKSCLDYRSKNNIKSIVLVEADTIQKVEEAVEFGADRVLLDNMSVDMVADLVKKYSSKIKIEVSGGITLNNISDYAKTGVDYISLGMLTHSAKSLDLSLLVE